MGVISFKHRGNFKNTEQFLSNAQKANLKAILSAYGAEGVRALAAATPRDSGNTAGAWDYEIRINQASVCINWTNSNVNQGIPIAILIQYGHATGTGGYVQGRDYINPAMQPVFDKIANDVWKEVAQQ